ncbi:conserved hypothetical protein [Crenothrix polyspora]|uniref:Uncharacterized protein n=1 Tax=Crenothrix polyspora TaxID=360316 RepID=A0A1R4H899_9GAMM|nr:hypothetical protein [Crenothrix polyspora]SJM92485.1 conserved hypothetical protein [Crenothrix polyspora]
MNMQVGEWIEVRSKEEILGTLDKMGRMEGLPFMPQMFEYCGKRFKVYKRAHKTCDFVYTMQSRSLPNGVHLDLRCDGAAYGGCQHTCLLYWKEAWLKRVDDDSSALASVNEAACTEADVSAGTHALNKDNEIIYTCQATEIPDFTHPLSWWDVRQYIEDYTSGNTSISSLLKGFAYGAFSTISRVRTYIGVGRAMRWFYDVFEFLWGPYPRRPGKIPEGQPTPTLSLNLQPGELVRIKSYNEILTTLTTSGKNRGMDFDAEMVPYCGRIFRVKKRVTIFLDEKTRKLVTVKNPCIILENVICQSRYSDCRMSCPRSIYSWWREIWLERVSESSEGAVNSAAETASLANTVSSVSKEA